LLVSAPVDCDPLTGLFPDHAPEAAQLVALVADQVSVELPPLLTALGPALRVTDGATAEAVTATVVDWVAVPPVPVHLRE
jgi:hypothetical protein